MVLPLKPNEVVPENYNDPSPDLERLIELINAELQEDIHKTTYSHDNEDGTFDSFRCVIYFDGNLPNNEDYREYVMWRSYHAQVMELYRQAGWIIKRWKDGTHFTHAGGSPVPKYCISLLQRSASDALTDLQDKAVKP